MRAVFFWIEFAATFGLLLYCIPRWVGALQASRGLLKAVGWGFIAAVSFLLLASEGCSLLPGNLSQAPRPATDILHLAGSEYLWPLGYALGASTVCSLAGYAGRFRPIWKAIVANLLLSPFLLLSPVLLFFYGCNNGMESRFGSYTSPDGRFRAEVQEMDGGAMDSFHSWVTVRSANHLHEATVFATGDAPKDIHLTWLNDRILLIDYDAQSCGPFCHEDERTCKDFGDLHVLCKAR